MNGIALVETRRRGFISAASRRKFTALLQENFSGRRVEFRLRLHAANCKGSVMDVCVQHGGEQPAHVLDATTRQSGRNREEKFGFFFSKVSTWKLKFPPLSARGQVGFLTHAGTRCRHRIPSFCHVLSPSAALFGAWRRPRRFL